MRYLLFGLLAIFADRRPDIRHSIAASIAKELPRKWGMTRKRRYSTQLATRIIIESKRRNLDPIALTAIAWTESHYRYWVTRKGDGSHGVYQLIPWDSAPATAVKRLAGCRPGPRLRKYWRLRWLMGNGMCEDQHVANHRYKAGRFSERELKARDNVISTYIAAYEVDLHRKGCIKRRHRPHLISSKYCKALGRETQIRLGRYAHFNSGPRKPRWYYLHTLCKRYGMINVRSQILQAP